MTNIDALFSADARGRTAPAEYDYALMWSALLLLALGVVMVYSASIAIAEGSRVSGQGYSA